MEKLFENKTTDELLVPPTPPAPIVPPQTFKYEGEKILEYLPNIISSDLFGNHAWDIVLTSGALYLVNKGMTAQSLNFAFGGQKKLSQEADLKTILSKAGYYYRASGLDLSGIKMKSGWFSASISFRDSVIGKVKINLKKKDLKRIIDQQNLNINNYNITQLPYNENAAPLKSEKLNLSGVVLPPMSEEELKQEKRRKKIIAWVLLVNALVNVGLTIWLFKLGVSDKEGINNVVPTIIDIFLAIALFKQQDVLKIIFVRVILGLLFWGGSGIIRHDWAVLAAQCAFCGYLIYHTKVKASAKTNKIALVILAIAVLIIGGSFWYEFRAGSNEVKEYNTQLELKVDAINENFDSEIDLLQTETDEMTDTEFRNYYTQVKEKAEKQKLLIADFLAKVDEGLKNYTDRESQNNLTILKDLYNTEQAYNNAVLDLSTFMSGLNYGEMTDAQLNEYQIKVQAVSDAYKALVAQSKKPKLN